MIWNNFSISKGDIGFYLFFWMKKVVKTKTNDMKMGVTNEKNDKKSLNCFWYICYILKDSLSSYAYNQTCQDEAY